MRRWEPEPIPPLRAAIISQILGLLIALGLAALIFPRILRGGNYDFNGLLAFALAQGVWAAFVSYRLETPRWWLLINLLFLPAIVLVNRLPIAPGWYLATFVVMLLVFWRTDQSRVPLYLSNSLTATAVTALLPAEPCHVIDLGCGSGSLLRQLARARPDCEFLGIEHAPLTWLWAKVAALRLHNCRIRHGDFWGQNLRLYDVAYAFLSPAPMPRLWLKAGSDMRPGSLLVSNSFEIPGIAPERVIEVDDRRATHLHCYRIPVIDKTADSHAFPPIKPPPLPE